MQNLLEEKYRKSKALKKEEHVLMYNECNQSRFLVGKSQTKEEGQE